MNRKNTKLKKVNLISSLFFVLVATFYLVYEKTTFSKQNTGDGFVSVVSVADGDTVSVMIDGKKEKIRLIGIDAPELGQKPWGVESKKYLESLFNVSGWQVKLEFDVGRRDRYGRLLAYIRTTDGKLINLLMIKSGYALLYTVPPNVKYVNELRSAQEEARNKRIGIWGEQGLKQNPRDYRKEHPRK
jgi:micrococcal nuclease